MADGALVGDYEENGPMLPRCSTFTYKETTWYGLTHSWPQTVSLCCQLWGVSSPHPASSLVIPPRHTWRRYPNLGSSSIFRKMGILSVFLLHEVFLYLFCVYA